ncbi:MAG: hypothetical protein ABDH32_04405 [Candidatus Caldarchaeales archaeon]
MFCKTRKVKSKKESKEYLVLLTSAVTVVLLLWSKHILVCLGENTCGGINWAPTLVRFGIYYRELNRIEAWKGEFKWSSNVFTQNDWFGTEYTRTESCTSSCSDDVYDFREGLRGSTWDTNLPGYVTYSREEYVWQDP